MVDTIMWSLIVFAARIVDVSLGTIRVNMIIRKKKIIAALIGFVEVTIFISVIVRIIKNVDNIYGILAYGAGFAVGTIVGIIITEKFTRDLVSTNIISRKSNNGIKDLLLKEGFAYTCYKGTGRQGEVEIINVVCSHTSLPKLNKLVHDKDSRAFVVSHMLDKTQGGFIRGLKKK
ncbi:MAG TPA: DUF5698 domain-containing protein [Candidatus Humimicrobiaceae bacterium]